MSWPGGVKPLALSPLNNHAHQLEGKRKRILDTVWKVLVGDLGPGVMVYPTCSVIITCLCGRGAGPEGIKQEPA